MFYRQTRHIDNPINRRSIGAYAKALLGFSRHRAPELTSSSFSKINATLGSELPRPEYLDVEEGLLAFRHYRSARLSRVLILIHGSGCYGDLMQSMASAISRRDVAQVYTIDMRGHGLSSGYPGHAVSYPSQLIHDIGIFVSHVRALHPSAILTLGGHSAGGGLVLAFSQSELAPLVDSYLFLAPFLGFGSDVNRPHFGGWVKLHWSKLIAITLANLFGIRHFNNVTVLNFNTTPAEDPMYTSSWSFETLIAFGPGAWKRQAAEIRYRKPALVLYLQDDECFCGSLYEQAYGILTQNAIVFNAGEGGHWDLLVNKTALVMIETFLLADESSMLALKLGEHMRKHAA